MTRVDDAMTLLCENSRNAGTHFSRKIAAYLVGYLNDFGYTAKVHEYPFFGWKLVDSPTARFRKPIRKKIACLPVVWSGSTGGRVLKGTIPHSFASMRTFEAYDFQLYSIADHAGKKIGCFLTRPDAVWLQPMDSPGRYLPHLIVDQDSCARINDWISSGKEIEVEFSVKTKYLPNQRIQNIVGRKKRRGSAVSKVIVCTHYDSFFNTVGAHDNASGVACLLRIAEQLDDDLRDDIEICFFDAEEWNKYGSYRYVDDLVRRGQLSDVKLVVNIDSVGVPDGLYIYCSPGVARLTKLGMERIREVAMDVFFKSQDRLAQFDAWPFQKNGCEVLQIGSRPKSPFQHWHSPKDSVRNVDNGFIDKVATYILSLVKNMVCEMKKQKGKVKCR